MWEVKNHHFWLVIAASVIGHIYPTLTRLVYSTIPILLTDTKELANERIELRRFPLSGNVQKELLLRPASWM
jgi:hypothetical protein